MLLIFRWSILSRFVRESNENKERISLVSILPSTEYDPGLSLMAPLISYKINRHASRTSRSMRHVEGIFLLE